MLYYFLDLWWWNAETAGVSPRCLLEAFVLCGYDGELTDRSGALRSTPSWQNYWKLWQSLWAITLACRRISIVDMTISWCRRSVNHSINSVSISGKWALDHQSACLFFCNFSRWSFFLLQSLIQASLILNSFPAACSHWPQRTSRLPASLLLCRLFLLSPWWSDRATI